MRKSILSALVVAVAAGALTFGSAQAVERGQGEFERICAPYPDRAAHQAKFAEFLGRRLKLNEAQKASFKDFQDARTKAVETATTRLCATKPDLSSFEGRLGFHQAFLEDRLEAVKAENPKLITCYKSLDSGFRPGRSGNGHDRLSAQQIGEHSAAKSSHHRKDRQAPPRPENIYEKSRKYSFAISPDSFLEALSWPEKQVSIFCSRSRFMSPKPCLDPVPLFRVVRERTEKPLILGIAGLTDEIAPTLTDMDAMGVPAFASPGRAAVAAWAITEDSKATYRKGRNGPSPESQPFIEKLGASPDEAQAKSLLKKINIATPVFAVCESHEEAIESFRKMKKPCVVKVLSPAITHKTEVGGVHLNIETDERLIDALEKIDVINAPGEKKYLLEEMAPDGLEIIIGAKNDVSFGPSVMAGLGGTAAEALGDTSIRIAPLDLSEALEMIAELRSAPLFDGWRGGPWYDKNAVAELLVKVGHFMVQHPEIKEVDETP